MGEIHGAETAKRAAAAAAVALVEDGMLLGLGTGSTARFVLELIAGRMREEGLRVHGIPTSRETEARAQALGIPLSELSGEAAPDLAIDGADEIEASTLFLIKGLGGALLREKIVASWARRLVVVADATKLVTRLGTRAPLPVEIVPFAHRATARRLEQFGRRAVLRRTPDGQPFVTDNGNFIYDLAGSEPISDPKALERALALIPGVVESGLFTSGVAAAAIGSPDGRARMLYPGG